MSEKDTQRRRRFARGWLRRLMRRVGAMLVQDDPNPEYSRLDRLDGLGQRTSPNVTDNAAATKGARPDVGSRG